LSPPRPKGLPATLSARHTAFFFDCDGTLVDLAATPDEVRLTPRTRSVLAALFSASDRAVAIISGRTICSLDALLGDLRLPSAGLHGAERRQASGAWTHCRVEQASLDEMARMLTKTIPLYPGMQLEHKGAALALHFRGAPEAEQAATQAAQRAVAQYSDQYALQPGKMVIEIKPKQCHKGLALAAFLAEPPFAGRTPFFAGDDLTDEAGFTVVNTYGGYSVKIGAGKTCAQARLASSAALIAWLEQSVHTN
jgi:trehalose 6-phosphate phosphatase